MPASRMLRDEIRTIASAAGAEFSGEQPDDGELDPLTKAEGLEELFLGVLKGQRDRVNGGDWQGSPQVPMIQQRTANRAGDQINSQGMAEGAI